MTCCECDVPLLCQLQEKALPLLAQEDSRISWDVAEDRFRWGILGSGICIDRTISDCHVHKAGLIIKVSGSWRSGTIRKENNYLIELEMWTSSEEQRIWGHLVLIHVDLVPMWSHVIESHTILYICVQSPYKNIHNDMSYRHRQWWSYPIPRCIMLTLF